MTHVALISAYVVGAVNAVVGAWGAWLWWRVVVSQVYGTAIRVAQLACGAQAVVAGILWLSGKHSGDGLYYLYALLPLFVGFAAEQLRILSAQTVLDARDLEDAQAVGRLPEREQKSVVVAIVRRETGIMALASLVIVFLCWRAAITL
jgi:hypothetical protein